MLRSPGSLRCFITHRLFPFLHFTSADFLFLCPSKKDMSDFCYLLFVNYSCFIVAA